MNNNDILEFLESCLNNNRDYSEDNIKNLIFEHKRDKNRLFTIIKQSDAQHKLLLQFNEELNVYKNNLELKVEEEIEKRKEKEIILQRQSKMAIMGEMIGNIAHQWKQPLSLISMSNGLIKLNQEDNTFSTEKELNEAINNIDNAVQHLSTTIDDFRNFFRPGKKKSFFNLKVAYSKTYNLISSQLKDNNIQIIDEINDIEVCGYQNELLQVLINIIKNAKDELIKLDRDKKRLIFIKVYEKKSQTIIKIKDNAGGIPNDIFDKIFNAYFTTKQSSEGTGIGLYMSKQILEGMNGEIEVSNVQYLYESITYNGAEFIIKIPFS